MYYDESMYAANLSKQQKHRKKQVFFDKFMYFIAFLGPFMIIPQIIQVWMYKQTQGVSLVTWAAFAFISTCWVVYGYIHEEKPIILTNFLLAIANFAVVVGVLLQQRS